MPEIDAIKRMAANGEMEAQFELGNFYYFDEKADDSREHDKQAFKWYRRAAIQGHAKAQAALASLYQNGIGTRKNIKQAFAWHRKAAERGEKECQRQLANALFDDDPEEAVHWYKLSAEAGDAEAQFKLAEIYEDGNGLPKNEEKAFYWYLSAEKLQAQGAYLGIGNEPRYAVGRCYATGQGVEKNSDEALKRLLPMADPKLTDNTWLMPKAQVFVAMIFADPEHVRHDLVEAYVWFNVATSYAPRGEFYGDMSQESLAQYRDMLGVRLSKDQLKAAQKRSEGIFVSRKTINKRLGIR